MIARVGGEVVEEQPVRDVDRRRPDRRDLPVDRGSHRVLVTEDHVADPRVTPHQRGLPGVDLRSVLDQERERGVGEGELAAGGAPRVPIGQTVDVGVERGSVSIVAEQEGVAALPVDVVDCDQGLHRRRPQSLALARCQRRQPTDGVNRRPPRRHTSRHRGHHEERRPEHRGIGLAPAHVGHRDPRPAGEALEDPCLADHVGLAEDRVRARLATQDETSAVRLRRLGPGRGEQRRVVGLSDRGTLEVGDLDGRRQLSSQPGGERRT